jgi:hypothetical protein
MKIQSEKLITEILEKEAKLDVGQALKLLLKNKNWKDIVRNVFKKKQSSSEKEAGLVSNILYSAVILLSTAMGASSAEDLISKIESKSKTVQQQKVPESQIVDKIEKLLPFPVSKGDLIALRQNNPLTGKPLIDARVFSSTLTKKVEKTIKNVIDPAVEKDPELQSLSYAQIKEIILKSFKQKLERPQFADAMSVLKNWLGKEKRDMNFVYDIVGGAIAPTVAMK